MKITNGFRFFLNKFLFPLCGIFTFLVVFLYALPDTDYLRKDKLFVLLLAAAGIALIDLVYFIPKLSVYFKVATHFILCTLLLLLILYLSEYMQTGNWVMILIGYALLYAVICPAVLLVRAAKKRKKNEQKKEEYEKKFQ